MTCFEALVIWGFVPGSGEGNRTSSKGVGRGALVCNASPVLDLNEPQIDTFSHVFFSAVLRDTACEGQQTALTFPTGLQGKHW